MPPSMIVSSNCSDHWSNLCFCEFDEFVAAIEVDMGEEDVRLTCVTQAIPSSLPFISNVSIDALIVAAMRQDDSCGTMITLL